MLDQIRNVLDCLSSVPDMLDACGPTCAFSQVMAVVLYPLFISNTIDCTMPVVVWLLGMCE